MSDYIPEETVFQILKSLPVKSLLRCRCVCKQWKQIIDSASFIQQHLFLQNQNPSPPCILHNKNRNPFLSTIDPCTFPPVVDSLNPPLDIEPTEYIIIGTLHGVICLYHSNQFFLWNPSIRKVSLLPLPEGSIDWDRKLHGAGRCFSAFWIDPFTKDFKIVLYNPICWQINEPREGTFYSSAKQRWFYISEGTKDFTSFNYHLRPAAVMLEGVAYWLAMSPPCCLLMSFDFGQERWDVNETPIPHNPASSFYIPRICNLRGNLSLVYCQHCKCGIYWRQEGLWVQIFGFDLSPDMSDVFWVWGNLEEERLSALVNACDELKLYDTKGGYIALGSDLYYAYHFCYGFVESLLFPSLPGF